MSRSKCDSIVMSFVCQLCGRGLYRSFSSAEVHVTVSDQSELTVAARHMTSLFGELSFMAVSQYQTRSDLFDKTM